MDNIVAIHLLRSDLQSSIMLFQQPHSKSMIKCSHERAPKRAADYRSHEEFSGAL